MKRSKKKQRGSNKATVPLSQAMIKFTAEIRECADYINFVLSHYTDDEIVHDFPSINELISCGNLLASAAQSICETPWSARTITKGGGEMIARESRMNAFLACPRPVNGNFNWNNIIK